MGGDTTNMHYWEYNSRNAGDGKPVDVSQRKPESRQLTQERDAEIIANYSNPAYVLGWKPEMAPLILSQPVSSSVATGQSTTFNVTVAGIPDATYQWYKNDVSLPRATSAALVLSNVKRGDAGRYRVTVTNAAGTSRSTEARLSVK
jgi:hypothetical protein